MLPLSSILKPSLSLPGKLGYSFIDFISRNAHSTLVDRIYRQFYPFLFEPSRELFLRNQIVSRGQFCGGQSTLMEYNYRASEKDEESVIGESVATRFPVSTPH